MLATGAIFKGEDVEHRRIQLFANSLVETGRAMFSFQACRRPAHCRNGAIIAPMTSECNL